MPPSSSGPSLTSILVSLRLIDLAKLSQSDLRQVQSGTSITAKYASRLPPSIPF
jgi:hypothetical protein